MEKEYDEEKHFGMKLTNGEKALFGLAIVLIGSIWLDIKSKVSDISTDIKDTRRDLETRISKNEDLIVQLIMKMGANKSFSLNLTPQEALELYRKTGLSIYTEKGNKINGPEALSEPMSTGQKQKFEIMNEINK